MSNTDMSRFILDKLEKVEDKLEEVRIKYSRLEESFKNHEDIDEKIHQSVEDMADNMNQQMSTISKSLDTYNNLLMDHMRRTEIAEENIKVIHRSMRPLLVDHRERGIIEAYADKKWKMRMKWVGGASAVLGLALTIMKLLDIF